MRNAKKCLVKSLCKGKMEEKKPSFKKVKKNGASKVSKAIKSGLTTLTRGGAGVTGGSGENLGVSGGARGGKPAPGQGVW